MTLAPGAPAFAEPGQAARITSADCAARAAKDERGAAAVAAACNARIEVLDRRTEFDQLYVEPSGARKLVSAIVPQRVRRSDGSWADINTSLRPNAGWIQPIATTAQLRFSAGGKGPLVSWREGTSTFTLSWPTPLPAPRVHGDTAVYEDVLPDVNLHVTAVVDGFRHVLEVETPEAAANPALRRIRYAMGGDMRVQPTMGGGLTLTDTVNVVVATASPASMWDSSVAAQRVPDSSSLPRESASGAHGPGTAARSARVDAAVDGKDLVLSPDERMMSSSRDSFPIFIDPAFSKLRSKWAYETSNGENNSTTSMRVGRQPAPDGGGERYRSFFEFDISALRGETIIDAEVQLKLDHSYSCDPTWVHMYRPGGNISVASGGRMTWGSRPLGSAAQKWLGAWEGNANEAGGCGVPDQGDASAVFDDAVITSDLQAAATANWTLYTLGLCACNKDDQNESTQDRWKQFYTDKTYLVVLYDRKPNPPTGKALSVTTDCYAQCSSPAIVRTTQPTLRVDVSDPHNGVLYTTFEVRTAASDTATLVATSPEQATATTPGEASWRITTGLSDGSTYYWRARTRDEFSLLGDWSAWQSVSIDTVAPVTSVNSAEYPFKTWGATVGTQGAFRFTAPPDLYDYTWSVDAGNATTSTSAVAYFTPTTDMVHTLHVVGRDKAGNLGETTDHQYWVKPLANRCWRWQLNQSSGATAPDTGNLDDSSTDPICAKLPDNTTIAAQDGVLSAGVTWVTTGSAPRDRFATFNGAGQITAPGPVLDTSKSFTVMAWVRASDLSAPTSWQTAVSQDGSATSRFMLGYYKDANAGAGGWCFGMTPDDTGTGSLAYACATGAMGDSTPPAAGEWVHLAGVYNDAAGTIQVHVMGNQDSCNGEMVDANVTGSWTGSEPLAIGRAKHTHQSSHYWRGDIDNVYAFQRPLAAMEICQQVL